jgi:predicted Rossmann fold flavoprotein
LKTLDLLVIGGGAAGFFGAIRYAEIHKGAQVIICEKKSRFLEKVTVSGGGRCNVTHDWSSPETAQDYYPRGADFLQDAFALFHCSDMQKWLMDKDVPTKIEADGRVFPKSDKSSSIVGAFMEATDELDIELKTNCGLISLKPQNGNLWEVETESGTYMTRNVLMATGSNRPIWDLVRNLGHTVSSPVASLFAFTTNTVEWNALAGISVPSVKLNLLNSEIHSEGPLLITHKGFSGPAVLKLSAWAARELERRNYDFEVMINWIGVPEAECLKNLKKLRDEVPKKDPAHLNPYKLPKRLNQHLNTLTEIKSRKMAELGNKTLEKWAKALCATKLVLSGKATNKEEFVTCGGIETEEVDSASMESKVLPGVYFAGEILNIDAITGGFNFQACWSGSNLAASKMK